MDFRPVSKDQGSIDLLYINLNSNKVQILFQIFRLLIIHDIAVNHDKHQKQPTKLINHVAEKIDHMFYTSYSSYNFYIYFVKTPYEVLKAEKLTRLTGNTIKQLGLSTQQQQIM